MSRRYDIRRSLYQMRQAGYKVPENIRGLVTPQVVHRIMRADNVTEREAQRRAIAAYSTHTVGGANPLVKKADIRGDLYYLAKISDKKRRGEYEAILKAEVDYEASKTKLGRAEMMAEKFKRAGNKGLEKIWRNRSEKIARMQRELGEASIGAGLLRTKKIGIPDVDMAGITQYEGAPGYGDMEDRVRAKSFRSIRERVDAYIDNFRLNAVEAVGKYPIPVDLMRAMQDRLMSMDREEIDELSKSDAFDVVLFFDYDALLNMYNLLQLVGALGVKPSDIGYSDADSAAQAIANFANSSPNVRVGAGVVKQLVGW